MSSGCSLRRVCASCSERGLRSGGSPRIPSAHRVAQRRRRLHVACTRWPSTSIGLRHRVALHQRVIAGEDAARQVPVRRPIEREYPIVLVRLQAHRVPIGRALRAAAAGAPSGPECRAPPRAPVEIMQHRSAPVALLRRRRGCREMHAERHFIRQRELIDVARDSWYRSIPMPALCRSSGMCHSGPAKRGNNSQNTSASGNAWPSIRPGIAQAARANPGTGRVAGQPQQGRRRQPADADEVGEQPKGIALQQRRQAHEINDQRDDVDIALRVASRAVSIPPSRPAARCPRTGR